MNITSVFKILLALVIVTNLIAIFNYYNEEFPESEVIGTYKGDGTLWVVQKDGVFTVTRYGATLEGTWWRDEVLVWFYTEGMERSYWITEHGLEGKNFGQKEIYYKQ